MDGSAIVVEPPPPQPWPGLGRPPLPPFLSKTFDMVEDPGTDELISWSAARNSFVVWDVHRFSITLLTAHFKHSNISSFFRQLNKYGFKKVDPDRWEYAHAGFLPGQRHLLPGIKRHAAVPTAGKSEVERLRRENVQLQQEKLSLEAQIMTMENRREAEDLARRRRQTQTVAFIARALKEAFSEELVLDVSKKRRVAAMGSDASSSSWDPRGFGVENVETLLEEMLDDGEEPGDEIPVFHLGS